MQPCCIINHTFVCGVCVARIRCNAIVTHIIDIGMCDMLVLLPRCPFSLSPVICHLVALFRLFAIVGFGLGVVS